MIRFATFAISLALMLTSLLSCEHDPELPPNEILGADSAVCFETQVLNIIKDNCARSGCHNGTGEQFPLETYGEISGQVNAGDPNGSELYKAINPNKFTNKVFMPPSSYTPLNNEQITVIELWILQGAKKECQK
jgi:hypothetical protein